MLRISCLLLEVLPGKASAQKEHALVFQTSFWPSANAACINGWIVQIIIHELKMIIKDKKMEGVYILKSATSDWKTHELRIGSANSLEILLTDYNIQLGK